MVQALGVESGSALATGPVSDSSFFSTNEASLQQVIYEFLQAMRLRPMLYPILEESFQRFV